MKALATTLAGLLLVGGIVKTPCQADDKPTQTGTIRGKVKYTGPKPAQPPVDPNGVQCVPGAPRVPILKERWVWGNNDTLQNVLVYVSKGVKAGDYKPPIEPVVLDQIKCVYTPHVIAIQKGQKVQFVNSDATLHNVFGIPRNNKNPPFNFAMPVKGQKTDKRFDGAEIGMRVSCNVHPWMFAYIHVVEHPYFDITRKPGTFEIKGLPPGEYELSVWHEFKRFAADKETIKVRVEAGKTAEVDFMYRPKKREAEK